MAASITHLATNHSKGNPTPRVLRIDASARKTGSTTRGLADKVIERLRDQHPELTLVERDLAEGIPFVTEAWVAANFIPAETRTPEQRAQLAVSDLLVAELETADILVIGLPIYNFGPPAALKAWIDQIARARVTFRYTENGPVGLLEGKKAYLVAASGGTAMGSAIDFATPYLRHVLGFVGIEDVTLIAADRQMVDAEAASDKAERALQSALPLSA
ncbi:FMN-dependent NADH-azoreductase [Algihabitans albus]|uniref:FMN-dependent NADH-azoreductase n=1 Tax=Algihabitans albus TaxID=2164067 RepID=UPI000E5D6C98|nr:NAD(P)H-dependent oxidoreductase [Algihabitans albus]